MLLDWYAFIDHCSCTRINYVIFFIYAPDNQKQLVLEIFHLTPKGNVPVLNMLQKAIYEDDFWNLNTWKIRCSSLYLIVLRHQLESKAFESTCWLWIWQLFRRHCCKFPNALERWLGQWMAIERLAKEKQQHLDLKKTDNVGKKRRI